jgi:hypothetical protein
MMIDDYNRKNKTHEEESNDDGHDHATEDMDLTIIEMTTMKSHHKATFSFAKT